MTKTTGLFIGAAGAAITCFGVSPAHAQKVASVPEYSACATLQTIMIDMGNRNRELDRYNEDWYNRINLRSPAEVARYNESVGRQNEADLWINQYNSVGASQCGQLRFNIAEIRQVCNVEHDQMARYLNNGELCRQFRQAYPMTSENHGAGDGQPTAETVALTGADDRPVEGAFSMEWVDVASSARDLLPMPPGEDAAQ